MSLQWKLILPKNKLRNLLFISTAFLSIVLLLNFSSSSCVIQHVSILNDLKLYEKSLDPEFCETLLERINSFDNQCELEIEILDCG